LVLASGSPRRRELLRALGLAFEVRAPNIDETVLPGEEPAAHVERLARAKAEAIVRPRELILAADTVVVLEGEIFGKPMDAADARRMLARLAGRTHGVRTGVAVHDSESGATWAGVAATAVRIGALDAAEIARYVQSGEPLDKAGAYGIQGLGALLVEEIDGNYTNVVGLPLPLVADLVREAGYDLLSFTLRS
jgi:septum formation protein